MIIYNYCLSVNFCFSSGTANQLNAEPIIQNNLSEIPTINKAVRQC